MNSERLHILLVEDDDAHAEIIQRNLARQFHPPRLARVTDGQAALDYLQSRTGPNASQLEPLPGLVLLDLRLPKVDGIEVLTRIKTDPLLQFIPVVILTTSATEHDIEAVYQAKANSYLVKSTDATEFSLLLETLCTYWLTINEQPMNCLYA
jgi:CheY-like chemotaxis protein